MSSEPVEERLPCGYFDGASNKKLCGGGMVFKLAEDHYYLMRMGCGKCSNICAKLLAFWGLLKFAIIKDMLPIQVFGDSRVIVDWAAGFSSLQVSILEQWCFRTRKMMDCFNNFSIKCIFRELNFLADSLSKKLLG